MFEFKKNGKAERKVNNIASIVLRATEIDHYPQMLG